MELVIMFTIFTLVSYYVVLYTLGCIMCILIWVAMALRRFVTLLVGPHRPFNSK